MDEGSNIEIGSVTKEKRNDFGQREEKRILNSKGTSRFLAARWPVADVGLWRRWMGVDVNM